MDKFLIKGGKKLSGAVTIHGVKNAILPMICGAMLAEEGVTVLKNVPLFNDLDILCRLVNSYGIETHYNAEKRSLRISARTIRDSETPYDLVKMMRASFLISGALLGRQRHFVIPLPGGCAIGARPINYHLNGFMRLGAQITESGGLIHAKAKKLKGAVICLDYPSHTATENLLMASVRAEGETVIQNAACEPEITDFINLLNKMGARIKGASSPTLIVEGVNSLRGVEYKVKPDRIVAGTLMAAAAITGSEVILYNVIMEDIRMAVSKFQDMGASITTTEGGIKFSSPDHLTAVDILTQPYPGFPTDLQPPFMAALSVARGVSSIRETVFENRFIHALELNRMGANIRITGDSAVVVGVPDLAGAPVMASDLRGGAALVVAGLRAEGETVVDRVYHIDRGYDHLEAMLSSLGADIKRVR